MRPRTDESRMLGRTSGRSESMTAEGWCGGERVRVDGIASGVKCVVGLLAGGCGAWSVPLTIYSTRTPATDNCSALASLSSSSMPLLYTEFAIIPRPCIASTWIV